MDTSPIVGIFREFFFKGYEILFPALAVSLAIVLVAAVLMAVMQIQEQSITFIPKLLGFVAVLYIMGPWMFDEIVVLIKNHIESLPSLL